MRRSVQGGAPGGGQTSREIGETMPLIGENAEVDSHIMDLRMGFRGGTVKILVGSAMVGTVRSDW